MKCLSLWQPWAAAIGRGKWNETRSWYSDYQGPLAIHAARRWTADEKALLTREPFRSIFPEGEQSPALAFGAIVAVVQHRICIDTRTVHVRTEAEGWDNWELNLNRPGFPFNQVCGTPRRFMDNRGLLWIGEIEFALGNYAPGREVHIYTDIHILPEPVPFRGAQGFFDCSEPALLAFAREKLGADMAEQPEPAERPMELAL